MKAIEGIARVLLNGTFAVTLLLGINFLCLPIVIAAPVLSVQQRIALGSLCEGSVAGLDISSEHNGLLVFDTSGSIANEQDQLPVGIQAATVAEGGLLLCRNRIEVQVGVCDFIFFILPRIRIDDELRLISVRSPLTTLASTRLQGSAPPACNAAGIVTAATTGIKGSAPLPAALLDFVDSVGINLQDTDSDGSTNLAELIAGRNPADPADAVAQLLVSANGSSALQLATGDALTIRLSFAPGPYVGQPATYYLWAETAAGLFSYLHPGRFLRSSEPLVSASGEALILDDFPVVTLPVPGIGEYVLHFKVVVSGGTTLERRAVVTATASNWRFAEVSAFADLNYVHGYSVIADGRDIARDRQFMAAGVAAGDYDRDGWVDLYVTRGSAGTNLLYHNQGDGTFVDRAAAAGVALSGLENSGATFADYDGDGWLDLLVAGINTTTQPVIFHNNRDSTFSNVTSTSGISFISQSMGSSFADYDKDGDLDFWMTHWTANKQQKYLWQNNAGVFSDVSVSAGIADDLMADYSVNFADINNDSWPDILVAGDFGTSQIYLNQHNGTFSNQTDKTVITDENGMGSAVGDYDNNGYLDWFVSSVFDDRGAILDQISGFNWGHSGNRFYRNDGTGRFHDLTGFTGVREGGWGWGSCFADFNNDGYLDLFHVNGYNSADQSFTGPFLQDSSRLFINNQAGGFDERAVELGINDKGQGRGIVCFDYDRDGDIDIFVANNEQRPVLYENRGLTAHWLHVKVAGERLNSEAIGARVYVTTAAGVQMRELSAGSNYMSQNPVYAYFGLGNTTTVNSVRVVWPSGDERTMTNVPADQILFVDK